jgi:hypothetical protein
VLLYQMKVSVGPERLSWYTAPFFWVQTRLLPKPRGPSLDMTSMIHCDHTRGRIVSILQLLEDRLEDIIGHATAA